MRILAIETATAVGSVALLEGDAPVREVTDAVPRHHLEWLAPAIQRLLRDAGWQPAAIEAVAVSLGPGSFTGLRIGVATAAAWARARGVPVVGVSTLAAVALGVNAAGLICPLLDARRGEVAGALFRRDGGVARVMDDLVAPVDRVLAKLPADRFITFAGDALARYGALVAASRKSSAAIAPREQWPPTATAVGRLAWERLSCGESDDPYLLRPIYVRPPLDWPA